MAITRARARFVRISPRKVRQVIDLIRGRDVITAETILSNLNKKAAYIVAKVLKSAIANAEHNHGMKKEQLYICKIYADQGPMLKRWRAASMGRAVMIRRRTSHITVELDIKEEAKIKTKAKGGKK
jgi:large subunit ribosomal protein L22